MADDQEDRTEEATQSRRDEFRRRGEVAQSKELVSALYLLSSALVLFALSKYFLSEISVLFERSYGDTLVAHIRADDFSTPGVLLGTALFRILAPLLAIFFTLELAGPLIQTGFLQVEDALSLKWERLNPISGLQKLISLRNLVEGFKSFLKILLIGTITYFVMKSEIKDLPKLLFSEPSQEFIFVVHVISKLLFSVGLCILILALLDYGYQRWEMEKRMRMTKQEIKEENKNRELDPQIKARMRRMQREVANKRMMSKVSKADVIVTNPTHIAVALRYGADLPAPQLVAKGADLVAEKIKEIARQHSIPIVENVPLARTIFKTMKLGQVIPRELYVAVAEVLSYVYKLRKKFASSSSAQSTTERNL